MQVSLLNPIHLGLQTHSIQGYKLAISCLFCYLELNVLCNLKPHNITDLLEGQFLYQVMVTQVIM